jgi:hypothetical protein
MMPFHDIFFNLNPNISKTSFPSSMPRITAADECDNFSKALKISDVAILDPCFIRQL